MDKPGLPGSPPAPSNRAPKLQVDHFSVWFRGQPALRDLSLDLHHGECLAIIGPAGSGKSTLLRSLNRLNEQQADYTHTGRILLDGCDIHAPSMEVTRLRHRIGLVTALPLALPQSIFENIAWALRLAGIRGRDPIETRVVESLRQAGLWDAVKDRLREPALRLLLGQQQQLCLARVLALEAEVVLLDNPCAGLDPLVTQYLEGVLQQLQPRLALVLVTHDNRQAARASDRTALLWNGELVECSPTRQFFSNPSQARTLDFITGRS